ncbi:hypothetical protein FOA52_010578 [Chlamydomonas sp. UWO 241]|nr:hypothetical protein FOA52_010578 [Chlamydomonas sp. UWO 241]
MYKVTGWDRLEVAALKAVPLSNSIKARAVGYAEGVLTADSVMDYWENYRRNEFNTNGHQPTKALLGWLREQEAHVRRHVDAARGHDAPGGGAGDLADASYWELMGLVMDQFDGFCEGIWDTDDSPASKLTYWELYLLQSVGDLYDLKVLFPQRDAPSATHAVQQPAGRPDRDYQPGRGAVGPRGVGVGDQLECSALIKLSHPAHAHGGGGEGGEDGTLLPLPVHRGGSGGRSGEGGGRASGGGGGARARVASAGADERGVQGGDEAGRTGGEGSTGAAAAGAGPCGGAGTGGGGVQGGDDGGRTGDSSGGAPPAGFWAGHTTWRPYYAMRRTWKTYDLPWSSTGPLSVSSSPGLVGYSKDDWYTSDRLVIMETTNGVYEPSLYDAIHTRCALMWQRVQVANLGADSGRAWVDLFSKHNSGTYNNQWMVLDVEALVKGSTADVLWVLEQLPGMVESADVTSTLLEDGYWASYNVPYFDSIYNASGYPRDTDLHATCPRARVFAREQPGIKSRRDFERVLRLNRYQDDALSAGDPTAAIAARYDLEPTNKSLAANWTKKAYGAVDAKVVDLESFSHRAAYVINGPTADDQAPFSWRDFCREQRVGSRAADPAALGASTSDAPAAAPADGCHISRAGLVDTFDFCWERVEPSYPYATRARALDV